MLWVIKPDRFVVLTPDGDMHDEMRNSWCTAQTMTGRRRYPGEPTNVVAFADPMEDKEMLPHITEGRFEGERISAKFLTPLQGLLPVSTIPITTPGAVARVSHRLRGRRATVRKDTLPRWTQQTKCARVVLPTSLTARHSMGRNSYMAPPTFLLGWECMGYLRPGGSRLWEEHGSSRPVL